MSGPLPPAAKPTMYFIGVTTAQSSINPVFPRWAEALQLGDCALCGIDLPVGAAPARYREIIAFIRRDPLSLGALVTTHKVAVHAACADLFDEIDPRAAALGEISSVYKRSGRLCGRAVDLESAGLALAAFVPAAHWRTGAEALLLGAGGAGTALAWHLAQGLPAETRPCRVHVVERDAARLEHLRHLHSAWREPPEFVFHSVRTASDADAVLARLPASSLVVNATGLGKDAPGSPLTDAAVFPERGFAWEFNYRGELAFLAQARAQQAARGLRVEDGWNYFLHGWTRVVADVFGREISIGDARFRELASLAAR